MLVSLYTSRVVLLALGVDDYGIYNVVGGVVTMFSFIMNTMSSASQRYLTYDLARGDVGKLRQTFSLVMLSQALLALIGIVLVESVGVWFLNTQMNIPADRIYAANWVLQFALLSYLSHVFAIPYLSVIISHEKMNVYAYVSIIDVVLKLVIVYVLQIFAYDRLIFYASLIFLTSLLSTLFYAVYCYTHYEESHFHYYFNRHKLMEMTSFAWWNMVGIVANILRSQGINILLNIFFSPAVNAARGISYQVNSAIVSFSNNFYTAVRPQIYKNYAIGKLEQMKRLIMDSSRYAFYLLLIITLPIILNVDFILNLWLKNVPAYTAIFVQLVLLCALLEVFYIPLGSGMQAVGKLRNYQLVVNGLYLLNLPISYIFLKNGYPPESTMIINIIIVFIDLMPRLYFCRKYYGLSMKRYLMGVFLKVWSIAIVCYCFGKIFLAFIDGETTAYRFLAIASILAFTFTVIYYVGITSNERHMLNNYIKIKKNEILKNTKKNK